MTRYTAYFKRLDFGSIETITTNFLSSSLITYCVYAFYWSSFQISTLIQWMAYCNLFTAASRCLVAGWRDSF